MSGQGVVDACCPDCIYWGLSCRESVEHHLRLAIYFTGRAERFIGEAGVRERRTRRGLVVAAVFLFIALVVKVAK